MYLFNSASIRTHTRHPKNITHQAQAEYKYRTIIQQ